MQQNLRVHSFLTNELNKLYEIASFKEKLGRSLKNTFFSLQLSKAALDQLTRCSALELAPKGIRVNSVNPGVIDTELFINSGMSSKTSHSYVHEKSKKIHPLGRCGRPDEVAKAITFLASTDASFICGQTLAIDGGRSVACPS